MTLSSDADPGPEPHVRRRLRTTSPVPGYFAAAPEGLAAAERSLPATSTSGAGLVNEVANVSLVDGRALINFASNNYLGWTHHPEVIRASVQATQLYGTGAGSSPLLSGHSQLHQRLCDLIAYWKFGSGSNDQTYQSDPSPVWPTDFLSPDFAGAALQSPWKTLLFSSGYAANLTAMTGEFAPGTQVFCDRKNHASLIDGLRLAAHSIADLRVRYFRHQDFTHLESLLADSSPQRPRWIVSDSVFSMDGTITRAASLLELAQKFDCGLIIDEAHACGVFGTHGSGFFSGPFAAQFPRLIVVGTLSKALAAAGGFLVTDAITSERILQKARSMIYSTGLPHSCIAAAGQAICLSHHQPESRQRLASHIHRIHSALSAQAWRVTGDLQAPLLSVIVGNAQQAQALAATLEQDGIFAPAIRPPTVKPLECRIRISPTASMSDAQIGHLIDSLKNAYQRTML